MKKNMIFSGAMSWMTALLLCTACSSDDVTTDKAAAAVPAGKVIHYTATVGEGDETRATLDGDNKYIFESGDKLIVAGENIKGELTLKDGDEGKHSGATFEGDLVYTGTGDAPTAGTSLTATLVSSTDAIHTVSDKAITATSYPETAIASTLAEAVQKYSHFTATSTYSSKSFSLSQQTSFLNFTVTFTDGTAANTDFDIVIKNDNETVRTGSVKTAEVDSKVVAQFVAAMPKGITMSSATVQLGTKSAIAFGGTTTLVANKIYNIKKTVTPSVPDGALSGQFTINSSGDKVYFSKGNLQAKIANYNSTTKVATASEWKFADSQDSYIGNAAGNTSFAADTWVDLFSWVGNSATNDTYGLITFTSNSQANHGNVSGESLKTDWGSRIGSGWRTLTKDEWTYVFGTNDGDKRSGATVDETPNARYTEATINTDGTGVNGIILFPDGATFATDDATWGTINGGSAWGTKCTTAQWTALEAKGCVFLPAAGYRDGTSVYNVGSYGYYWSSTAYGTGFAYNVYFNSGYVSPASNRSRNYGFSVRLVRPVE